MTDAVLKVENLRTHFFTKAGVVKSVDDVSFEIGRGKVMGLVGESGSGKSVSGFSIMGLVDPPGRVVSGSILYRGRDLVGLPEAEMRQIRGRHIAMIFQDPMMTLNPVLRIDAQMVETVLAHRAMSRSDAWALCRDTLGEVGIPSPDERMRAYPHQFSGGMRQRVAIAIALLNKPELIIADEPTTALDATVQYQILKFLAELRSEIDAALILISHDLAVVSQVCDRVYVMYAGQIVESATTADLFANPGMPYTWGLLDSVPRMDAGRKERLVPIRGLPPSLVDPPAGCRFEPRCPFATARCRDEPPPLREVSPQHYAACWYAPIEESPR